MQDTKNPEVLMAAHIRKCHMQAIERGIKDLLQIIINRYTII